MADIGPETGSRLPIEQYTRQLLECAKAKPQMISRTRSVVAGGADTTTAGSRKQLGEFPSISLLADPTCDIKQYLEDLASIAISAARQAEDVQRQASDTSRKTRYAMAVVVTFGVLGLSVGSAGFIASRSASSRLAEVGGNLRTVEDLQRQTNDQLAAIRSSIEEQNARGAITAAAITVPPMNHLSTAPSPPSPVINAVPWPEFAASYAACCHGATAPAGGRPFLLCRRSAERQQPFPLTAIRVAMWRRGTQQTPVVSASVPSVVPGAQLAATNRECGPEHRLRTSLRGLERLVGGSRWCLCVGFAVGHATGSGNAVARR